MKDTQYTKKTDKSMPSQSTAQIVELRKKKVPGLKLKKNAADSLIKTLTRIENSEHFYSCLSQNSSIKRTLIQAKRKLQELSNRLADKIPLYETGTVTVSYVGLESSGKTTLLNTLTGAGLPAGEQRCTAVACEICYINDREKEQFTAIYFTEAELIQLVNDQWSYMSSKEDAERNKSNIVGPKRIVLPEISNIDDIKNMALPDVNSMSASLEVKFRSIVEQLDSIKSCLMADGERLLGTTSEPCYNMDDLKLYVTHKDSLKSQTDSEGEPLRPVSSQPLIRIVQIRKTFRGGVEFMRFYDTPGINDTNPAAKRRTREAAKKETDLLVIVDRPGDRPSVTEEWGDVISMLNEIDKQLIAERTRVFINYIATKDNARDNAETRIDCIKKQLQANPLTIYEDKPHDAKNEDDVRGFLDYIVRQMKTIIPEQDKMLIQSVENEWSEAQSCVAELLAGLQRIALDTDPATISAKKADLFDEWFDYSFNPDAESPGNHFMQRLKIEMGELTAPNRKVGEELSTILQNVVNRRKEAWDKVETWLRTHASETKCKELIDANNNPNDKLLPSLAELMGSIVCDITAEAERIGPDIQKEILDKIRVALDVRSETNSDRPSTRLCGTSEQAYESLETLCTKLSLSNDSDVKFIVKSLSEIAGISERAGYIMRYELRPALNLLDPFRWQDSRRQCRNKETLELIYKAGSPEDKYQLKYVKAKSVDDSTEYKFEEKENRLTASTKEVSIQQELGNCTKTVLAAIKGLFDENENADPDLCRIAKLYVPIYEKFFKPHSISPTPRTLCTLWLQEETLSYTSAKNFNHFYKMLAYTTLLTMDAVLNSNVNRFEKLKDDFLSEASQTLATQLRSASGWKKGLRRYQKDILGGQWRALDLEEQKGVKYKALVDDLEESVKLHAL